MTVLTAVAMFYGIAWLVMNVYNYYPVARAGVERVVTGEPNTAVSFVGTDGIKFADSDTYLSIDVRFENQCTASNECCDTGRKSC